MNQKQKLILVLTAILIAFSVLFPPFQFEYQTRVVNNLGFGFLFRPPEERAGLTGSVNSGLLSVEIFAVGLSGGLLALAFRDKR